MYYYPNFIGGKTSKMKRYFRKDKTYPIGNPKRYPIKNCIFRFPVDVSFGSVKPSEPNRLRINTPQGIKISSNKVLTKNTIKDHCPILLKYNHASRYITDREIKLSLLEEEIGFPLVAKLKYGMGGKGMKFINNVDDLYEFVKQTDFKQISHYFFEEYFLFTDEYRIHVSPLLDGICVTYKYQYALLQDGKWNIIDAPVKIVKSGEILGIKKKVTKNIQKQTRNFGDGVVFSSNFTRPDEWDDMVKASVKAASLAGLDFCCTDIMYNKHTRKWYISEMNTNPGMDSRHDNPIANVTAQHYQQAFPRIILEKYAKSVSVLGSSRTYPTASLVR